MLTDRERYQPIAVSDLDELQKLNMTVHDIFYSR